MLKEKIMRFCIQSLMKLEEVEGAGYVQFKNIEDDDMDEEDHEALCNLFTTVSPSAYDALILEYWHLNMWNITFLQIGSNIDNPKAQPYMKFYFDKIVQLSNDKSLSSRSRFMYKDLIEMRAKGWKLRRELETAKTIAEIRKDAEREERMQAQQSQQSKSLLFAVCSTEHPVSRLNRLLAFSLGYRNDYAGRGGGGRGRGGGRGYDDRNDSYRGRGGDRRDSARYDNRGPPMDNRGPGYGGRGVGGPPPAAKTSILPPATGRAGKEPKIFTEDKLKNRAKSMRQEWMETKNEDDLLYSMDEVLNSPDAGKIIVGTNTEYAIKAKAPEHAAINEIIAILFH